MSPIHINTLKYLSRELASEINNIEHNILFKKLSNCPDCGAKPGEIHADGCDVERCSVCGGQRLSCTCKGHDKAFARWSGFWPGILEAEALGIDLNEIYRSNYHKVFFVKPCTMGAVS